MPYRDPEKQRAAVRESQRRRRAAGAGKARGHTLPELAELRLETAKDVVALLGGQVRAVIADPKLGTVERARTIGYLASCLLRAIETGDLAERLEALESMAATSGGRWNQ